MHFLHNRHLIISLIRVNVTQTELRKYTTKYCGLQAKTATLSGAVLFILV